MELSFGSILVGSGHIGSLMEPSLVGSGHIGVVMSGVVILVGSILLPVSVDDDG